MSGLAQGHSFVLVDPEGGQVRLPVSPRESLRAAMLRRGLPLTSFCGGSAICGTCWVEVLTEGLPPPAPDELSLLNRFAESAERPRLACRLTTTETHPEIHVRLPSP